MVTLFAEEATLLEEFFSAIALKGAMTTELKSETGTVVDDLVLEITEDLVRCRMLDVHTRESVFLDVSFAPGIPGNFKEESMKVPIKNVGLIHNIVSMFSKGETVYFDTEEDKLVIHNKESSISTSLPLADISSIKGYDEAVFESFALGESVPKIKGDPEMLFNIKAKVDVKSMRIIEKLSSALKTPLVKVTWKEGKIFLNTTDSNSIKSASIKVASDPVLENNKDAWAASTINASNEYPIGLIPVMKQLDDAVVYARSPDIATVKQILFVGERNKISKIYVIGPAGRMDDSG